MEFFKLRHKNLKTILIIVILLSIFFSFNSHVEAKEKTVELNADKIIYDDLSGTASAEGNAVLKYGDVMIFAERIDYDDESGKVIASSLPDVGVTLRNRNQAIRGDRLLYDINTTEGVMYGAKTTVVIDGKPVFVYGDNLEAIPYEIAVERKLISDKGSFSGDYVIKWDNVSITTCVLDHPHYRLEAKRFIFTPGHRVVVKRPRLYLGEKYVFTYPFDYIINVERDRSIKAAIFPYASYQSSKGTGVGFSGPITWDSGGLSIGTMYWTDIGFEWNVALEQKLGNSFSFYGELDYSWDRMWEEKKYRPDLSLRFQQPFWYAQLNWRRNQYLEIQKHADYQYRGEVDTEPEFLIGTPWRKEGAGWYRFSAMWGSYKASTINDSGVEEVDPWTGRLKVTTEGYVESNAGPITPFLNINASMMFYDDDDSMRQDVIRAIFGLRYNLGSIKLGTAYARNWASGESPMRWDAEFDSERIYQMFEIPLGKYLSFNIIGGYDLNASFLEEINYTLRYINDCMLWELTYRNDRNSGGENKIFFRIGFTGTSIEFISDKIFNPFISPVPKK